MTRAHHTESLLVAPNSSPPAPDTTAIRPSILSRGRRVALVTLILFIGLEIGTRTFLFSASKDFSRFRDYPRRARKLVEQPGLRIAFIGNSLTGCGISGPMFEKSLTDKIGGPVNADVFTADASKINTWYYLINRYFWQPRNKVDLLVIPYYETNLADGNRIELGRFAQFFVTMRDWPEVFRHDVTSASQRLEFVVSSFWSTYAARARIEERVLSLTVPHYQQYVTWLHQSASHTDALSLKPTAPATHTMLQRLLDRARANGTRVVFVAFPTIIPGQPRSELQYEIHPDAKRIIAENGMDLIDMRHTPDISLDMYTDDIHLDARGQAIFSKLLANELAKRLPKVPKFAN